MSLLLVFFVSSVHAPLPTLDCVVSSITRAGGSFADGPFGVGTVSAPKSIVVNSSGAMYVADEGFMRIRILLPNGVLSTLAGNGAATSLDGVGTAATFNRPVGVSLDVYDPTSLWVAEYTNHLIRKINLTTGYVTRIAGVIGSPGYVDGPALTAKFISPLSVSAYNSTCYVSDNSNRIRFISNGLVTSYGSGIAGWVDGPCDTARISPRYLALSPFDPTKIYFTSSNQIRFMTIASDGSTCTVSTLAGNQDTAWVDGIGTKASFNLPYGISFDLNGNIILADSYNNRVRRISTVTGQTATLAGNGRYFYSTSNYGYTVDGVGLSASFNGPRGTNVAPSGMIYVCEGNTGFIRTISCPIESLSPTSVNSPTVTTSATPSFSPTSSYSSSTTPTLSMVSTPTASPAPGCNVTTLLGVAGKTGYANGIGTSARLANVTALASNASGAVFFTERVSHTIRVWIPETSIVSNFTGRPYTPGFVDGVAGVASFNTPSGMAGFTNTTTNVTTLYVVDYANNAIRMVSPLGTVTTLIGTGVGASFVGRLTSSATIVQPWSIAIDKSGTAIYFTDTGTHAVRVIYGGFVSAIMGTGSPGSTRDGNSGNSLYYPRGIFVVGSIGDDGTMIYVTESSQRVRAIAERSGLVTTISGNGTLGLVDSTVLESTWDLAYAASPQLAIDPLTNGLLVVSSHSLRLITSDGVKTLAGSMGLGTQHFSNDGYGTSAQFDLASGLVVVGPNEYIVSEAFGCVLRRISCPITSPIVISTQTPSPTPAPTPAPQPYACTITSISGKGASAGSSIDGALSVATFNAPVGVIIGPAGSGLLYIIGSYVATYDNAIRSVSISTGYVTTIAGNGATQGYVDGIGTVARFMAPSGGAFAQDGTLYIVDKGNHCIRSMSPTFLVGRVASSCGSGISGTALGSFTVTRFLNPTSLAVSDVENALYVSDSTNNRIVRLALTTSISTAYSSGIIGPRYFHLDTLRSLMYVSDKSGIVAINMTNGILARISGSTSVAGYVDGRGLKARWSNPLGIGMHPFLGLIVADFNNFVLRNMNVDTGEVTTIAGTNHNNQSPRDGPANFARLGKVGGLAVDTTTGITYFADTTYNMIRAMTCAAAPTASPTPTTTMTPTRTMTPSFGGVVSMSMTPTLTPTPSSLPTATPTPGLRACFIKTLAGNSAGSPSSVDGERA